MTQHQRMPAEKKRLNKAAYELRKYLGAEEQAELDQLLWSPVNERERYRSDPVAFVREVLKAEPTPYQRDILRSLAKKRRVCVRGPHGMGKTGIAAMCILWFIAVNDECKIPTTASAWRQLTDFLWPEIHKWALRAEWWRVGVQMRSERELLKQRLELGANRFAFALASVDEAKIEGAHSEAILYLFDEAKTIPPAIWDAAEGALSAGQAYALALSTPGDSSGRFYDIQTRKPGYEDWHVVHVTLEQAIAAGRINADWAEQRAKAWGPESTMYRRRVLGEFAEDSADTVIPLSLIEAANRRWLTLEKLYAEIAAEQGKEVAEQVVWGPLSELGVDPARFGHDETGYAFRYGKHIRKVFRTAREETMHTTGRAVGFVDTTAADVRVDVNGLGAGVFDRLREVIKERKAEGHEPSWTTTPINVSTGTKMRDKTGQLQFHRLRDWLWWNLREILESGEAALPPDEQLTADLVMPKWQINSSGKILVESKDDMRTRLGRSPDTGEAVMLAFAPEEAPYHFKIAFL